MRKILIALLVIVVGYIAVAIAAWHILPKMIVDSDRRLIGVRLAIAKLSNDQLVLSQRMLAITDATLGKGKSKVDEVTALLSDPDINHLAVIYMGSDWAIQKSSFMGAVSHMRELVKTQLDARKNYKSKLAEKIEKLEARKKSLGIQLRSPSTERAWHVEMRDIEEQLSRLRNLNAHSEEMQSDADARRAIEDNAKNEAEIFKLATDYQGKTVGALSETIAVKLGELRVEENKPERLRRIMSPFNIWPINLISRMPLELNDEKQL